MGTEPVLWSSEQHAWLGAMGLTVYAEASTVTWPPAAPGRPAPVFDNLAPSPSPSPSPERRRMPEMVDSPVAPSPQRRAAPPSPAVAERSEAAVSPRPPRRAGGRISGLPDKLMLALLRASGQNPGEPATQALMASWPLDALRADPAAKRALWPQLRALRRQRSER